MPRAHTVRRLLSATHPAGGLQPNEFYSYDAVGNRLTSHLSHFYTYSWQAAGKGNRLLQDNQFDYAYDDEGNVTRKTGRANGSYTEFLYDYRNRIISITRRLVDNQEVGRISFVTDPFGRRIGTRDLTDTTAYIYDGLNPIFVFKSSSGSFVRRMYSQSVDSILAEEFSGRRQWYLNDGLGTPTEAVADSGITECSAVDDSFGTELRRTGCIAGEISFTGRERQIGSDLLYYRARWYAPSLGRFLSEDLYGPFQYDYADQNPLSFRDPSGNNAIVEFGIKAFAAVSTAYALASIAGDVIGGRSPELVPTYCIGVGIEALQYEKNQGRSALEASNRAIDKTFSCVDQRTSGLARIFSKVSVTLDLQRLFDHYSSGR
jgi:RHS repeat-associated protein